MTDAPSAWRLEQAVSIAQATLARLQADGALDETTDTDALLAAMGDAGTDVEALIRRLILASIEAKALATAAAQRIADLKTRHDRFERRHEAWRGAAFAAMDALSIKTLPDPEFAASITAGRIGVVITDEAALPDDLVTVVTTRTPNKNAIKAKLSADEAVAGAELQNGTPIFTVRTK